MGTGSLEVTSALHPATESRPHLGRKGLNPQARNQEGKKAEKYFPTRTVNQIVSELLFRSFPVIRRESDHVQEENTPLKNRTTVQPKPLLL